MGSALVFCALLVAAAAGGFGAGLAFRDWLDVRRERGRLRRERRALYVDWADVPRVPVPPGPEDRPF